MNRKIKTIFEIIVKRKTKIKNSYHEFTLFQNYEGHFTNILYIGDEGMMNKFNEKFKEVFIIIISSLLSIY